MNDNLSTLEQVLILEEEDFAREGEASPEETTVFFQEDHADHAI